MLSLAKLDSSRSESFLFIFLNILDNNILFIIQCKSCISMNFDSRLSYYKSFSWFNLSSKYYNSMENITGKRSDHVRKIINIAQ